MCDYQSVFSAGLDIWGGMSEAKSIASRGKVQALQFEANAILSQAQGSSEQASIYDEFREASSSNIAAMAVTGLDPSSFASIEGGNKKNRDRAVRTAGRNADRQASAQMFEATMAKLNAQAEASAARFSGFMSAIKTIGDAEDAYQEAHLGETRAEYFKRGVKKSTLFQLIGG